MTVTIYFKGSSLPFQFNLKKSQISKTVDLALQNPVEHLKYHLNYCKEFSVAPPFFTRSQLIRFNRCIKLYGCVSSLIYRN